MHDRSWPYPSTAPAEPSEGPPAEQPAWLARLRRCYTSPLAPPAATALLPQTAGLLPFVEPLLADAARRLCAALEQLEAQHGQYVALEPFIAAAVEGLAAHMLRLSRRTLILELHVMRLQGALSGASSEERFAAFGEQLRQPEVALAIMAEYPVLARQLVLAADQWADCSYELVVRWLHDREAIGRELLAGAEPGLLVRIDGELSDRHRGGRSVLIAHLSSGARVVYKPKSLAVDLRFQTLLAWLDDRGELPSFYRLRIIDRGTYGWSECVTARPCTTAQEVERFYWRQGAYLCLLYALEATDLHHENLIAVGEHPVLVDLESLLHPYAGGGDNNAYLQASAETFAASALRVGLLPAQIWAPDTADGLDQSGLGGTDGQQTPLPVLTVEGGGTDEMRIVRRRLEVMASQNRPQLAGVEVRAEHYTDAVVDGFTTLYHLLVRRREALLAPDGPLEAFAELEVRAILRPTRLYIGLLQESVHPDLLRDARDRDRFFDQLQAATAQRPALSRAVAAERADLWRFDVPIFTARPGSRDLWTSAGEQSVDFFAAAGLERARRRIGALGDDDLRRQAWLVRASLASLGMTAGRHGWGDSGDDATAPPATAGALRGAAQAIARHLESLAFRSSPGVTWLGLTPVGANHWALQPMGIDLYSGLPGITLFYAYLSQVCGDERAAAMAHDCLQTLRHAIRLFEDQHLSIGAFNGWGGVIYLLAHLGALWEDRELLDEAERIAGRLQPLIEADTALDIVAGAAGCVGGLISLYRCLPSPTVLGAATRCGERLLATAQQQANGVGWASAMAAQPLTGFSHGAAGIAWALHLLTAVTEDRRYAATAAQALAYEHSLFSPDQQNWPDLRQQGEVTQTVATSLAPSFMTAWCHGAPGIGLARLAILGGRHDLPLEAEITAALGATLRAGHGSNDSLCHGALGNLELLLQAGLLLPGAATHTATYARAGAILERAQRRGWRCGVPGGAETPGLMVGLAGIGYQLLRLAAPDMVPSVLNLEPPLQPSLCSAQPPPAAR